MRTRRRPVHLVDEHDVVKDGAGDEAECAAVEDARARDVGGQQVGGPLDPGERQSKRSSECPGEQCLADAGNIFDERVPVGEQRDEE